MPSSRMSVTSTLTLNQGPYFRQGSSLELNVPPRIPVDALDQIRTYQSSIAAGPSRDFLMNIGRRRRRLFGLTADLVISSLETGSSPNRSIPLAQESRRDSPNGTGTVALDEVILT